MLKTNKHDSARGNAAKMARLVAEGVESIADIEVGLRTVKWATPQDVLWDQLARGKSFSPGGDENERE